jgi:hypothetical protein
MLLGPTLAVVSLTVADASTAEVRSLPAGDGAAVDLSTSPSALLTLSARRSAWAFGYSPRIALLNVTRQSELAVFHNAFAGYAWWAKRVQLRLGVHGSIGSQSFVAARAPTATAGTAEPAPGPGQEPTTPDAMPAPVDTTADPFLPQREVVETGSAGVTFDVGYRLAPRFSLALGVAFDVSGGIGDSEPLIPYRRTAVGSASLTYNLTRRDDLTTSLSTSITQVPEVGSRFVTITALETWSHRFGLRTNGSLGAGATYLRSRATPDSDTDNTVQANGSASLSQGFLLDDGATLTAAANVALDTGYNQVLGVVGQRASGQASLAWQRDRVSAGASFQTSQTLPLDDPNAALSYGAGVNFGVRVADPFQLQAGGSWSHQVLPESAAFTSASADQWSAFIGFTLTLPILGG